MEARVRFAQLLPEDEEGYRYEVENLTQCHRNADDLAYWVEHFLRQAPSVTRYALEANRFLAGTGAPEALSEDDALQAAARFVREWERWSAGLQVTSQPALQKAGHHYF
jgi:hypothetical protein